MKLAIKAYDTYKKGQCKNHSSLIEGADEWGYIWHFITFR